MAIKTTMTFTRPSTDIAWFMPSDIFKTYHMETYVNTGKKQVGEVTESADGLTKTWVAIMVDEENQKAYAQDSNVQSFLNARDLYCIQNGISLSRETEEV
jgi:hypothetical protein